MKSVIVVSGGMDSAVLLTKELADGHTVTALSFDYGAKHNSRELPMAQEMCAKLSVAHTVMHLPFINEHFSSSLLISGQDVPDGAYDSQNMKSTVVPFRNGILIAIAVGFAESVGASRVLIGSHSGDHHIYPDCRPAFNRAMDQAAQLGTDGQVSVVFPFAAMDKRAIGDLGRTLGVDFARTWTCYKGGTVHCGTCGACDERKYALRHDQNLDPTVYQQ